MGVWFVSRHRIKLEKNRVAYFYITSDTSGYMKYNWIFISMIVEQVLLFIIETQWGI